jgi:EAL domain-containing protein (putative c-di-GMP-specific phosphodiesterase class I)
VASPLYEHRQIQWLRAGEEIFKEGDKGKFAYIVEEGEIEIWTIIRGERFTLNVLGAGSLFGELALIDQQPRSASATAKIDSLLILVTHEQLHRRIHEADPILKLLLWIIVGNFRSETNHFRAASNNFSAPIRSLDQLDKTQLSQKISDTFKLIRMKDELKDAIAEKEFNLVYQPIINLENNQIEGFEALIRWQSSRRGYVYPDAFIPLAESTSLIIPIGQWVIKQGIEDLKKIREISGQHLFMSFNIAGCQIEDPSFIPWLLATIQEAEVQPSQIKLEILERTLFNGEHTLAWVRDCHAEGFLVVLDDFGTGYSSLQYLHECSLDGVKIDKSFVQGIGINPNSHSICQAIINLSEALKIAVIAEGIETVNHLQTLKTMGCRFGQGYLFSRPIPFENAIAFLNEQLASSPPSRDRQTNSQ